MWGIKACIIALLLSLNVAWACEAKRSGNAPQAEQTGKGNVPVNRPPVQDDQTAAVRDLKIVSEGQHSSISNAFIFVARDADAYAALGKIVPNLQSVDDNFFQSNAVVAAFLGERRTGGYAVTFSRTPAGKLRVDETRPPRGGITTQVITAPFAVASVSVRNQESLALEVGNSWRGMIRPYKVKEGEFTMSGGITGRSQKFAVTGSLGVMREGNLVTLLLDLQGKNGATPRVLKDVASGLVQGDRGVNIGHLGAGAFVDQPADALRATVLFAAGEKSLSLTFSSIPGRIADGYNGRGTLTAETLAPAPQKKKPSTGDAPL